MGKVLLVKRKTPIQRSLHDRGILLVAWGGDAASLGGFEPVTYLSVSGRHRQQSVALGAPTDDGRVCGRPERQHRHSRRDFESEAQNVGPGAHEIDDLSPETTAAKPDSGR